MGISIHVIQATVIFIFCSVAIKVAAGNGVERVIGSDVLCGNSTCAVGASCINNTCVPKGCSLQFGMVICAPQGNPQNSQRNQNPEGESKDNLNSDACMKTYESLMVQCWNQRDKTAYTCDENNDSSMSSIMNGASQLTLALGSSTASSVQKSCSDMGMLMQGANGALAGYRMNCDSSITDCVEVCERAKQYAYDNNSCMVGLGEIGSQSIDSTLTEQAIKTVKQCQSFKSKVAQANQAIENFKNTLANAANCKNAAAADQNLAKLPQFCASQPNYPGCNPSAPVDCSKKEMATNKVCVCSKTPFDPTCSPQQKTGGDYAVGGIGDPSSRLNNTVGDDSFGGDRPDLSIEHGNPNMTAGKAIDGHQGSNSGLGGGDSGGGGPPGSGNSASNGSGDTASGSSGFYGGSGSGAGGVYNSAGAREGYTAAARYAASIRQKGNPDLRKFLPGGQYDPRRGLSGMTGPDGITGPHTDIWMKIQIRYRVTSPSLLP